MLNYFGAGSLLDENTLVLETTLYHQRSRHHSGGSAASSLSSGSCSPPTVVASFLQPGTSAQQQTQGPAGGRKLLDRSLSEPAGQTQGGNTAKTNTSRYKTEMCRPYEENGYCKYGSKCQFAHGAQELRSVARHPKYKTDLCRTYHTIGFCPYGPRCHFIHNEDERKLGLIQMKQQQQAALAQQIARQTLLQQQQRSTSPPDLKTPALAPLAPTPAQLPAIPETSSSQLQISADWQPSYRPSSLSLSMGSAASSVTDSPIPSPTSSLGDDNLSSFLSKASTATPSKPCKRAPPGFHSPPPTAPAALAGAFTFPVFPAVPPPTVDPDLVEATELLRNVFAAAENQADLPSPVGPGCPTEPGRLPIFSQLSQDQVC